jgi:hypothetical protein
VNLLDERIDEATKYKVWMDTGPGVLRILSCNAVLQLSAATLSRNARYKGIGNTIVQLIRPRTSGVIAPSQPIRSEERHSEKNGLSRTARLSGER